MSRLCWGEEALLRCSLLGRTARKQEGANPFSLLCPLLAKLNREPVGKAEMWSAEPPASLRRVQNVGFGAERQ